MSNHYFIRPSPTNWFSFKNIHLYVIRILFFSIYSREMRKESGANLIRCRVAEIRPNLLALIGVLQFGPFRRMVSIERLCNQWKLLLFGVLPLSKTGKIGKWQPRCISVSGLIHWGKNTAFAVHSWGTPTHTDAIRPLFLCDNLSDICQISEGQQNGFLAYDITFPAPLRWCTIWWQCGVTFKLNFRFKHVYFTSDFVQTFLPSTF